MKFTLHDNATPITKTHTLADLLHNEPELVLSPVPATEEESGDELLESIHREQAEDTITLEEMADPVQLDGYWTKVHDDLENDPQWFNFAED